MATFAVSDVHVTFAVSDVHQSWRLRFLIHVAVHIACVRLSLFFRRRRLALELVSGADFWCPLPGDAQPPSGSRPQVARQGPKANGEDWSQAAGC